ncbi:MAG: putative DNA binding domain-containing protein [Clostridia bacterium]|nr:putative DNA binding domain-containing protein [Clostridia bacterium]
MPEKQNIEWKTEWKDEQLKWICGFANAQGGKIYIGKADDGSVTGIKNSKKLLEDIPNKIKNSMGIIAEVNLHDENGKEYIEIVVEPYTFPISYYGQYYYRSGSTNQLLTGIALQEFLNRKSGVTWDASPVPNVSIDDLSDKAIKLFKERAARKKRIDNAILEDSNAVIMKNLRLYDNGYLNQAAVLLFHDNPEKYINGAYIKIGFFETDTELRFQDEVHGSLIEQVDKAVELLKLKYMKAWISYEGIQRVETYPYPDEALREAIFNAVAHKQYSSGIPIQISVYSDKMYIYNNGKLPEEWTIEKLFSKHPSQPYNPLIAYAFFIAGYIESWGRGIGKICEACLHAGLPKPEYDIDATGIMLQLKAIVDWDGNKIEYDKEGNKIKNTPQVAPQVAPQVDARFKYLMEICIEPKSREEMQHAMKLKDKKNFVKNYIKPMIENGLIVMTIPEKPQSQNQKYKTNDIYVATEVIDGKEIRKLKDI